jgi:hypothetical protein
MQHGGTRYDEGNEGEEDTSGSSNYTPMNATRRNKI